MDSTLSQQHRALKDMSQQEYMYMSLEIAMRLALGKAAVPLLLFFVPNSPQSEDSNSTNFKICLSLQLSVESALRAGRATSTPPPWPPPLLDVATLSDAVIFAC